MVDQNDSPTPEQRKSRDDIVEAVVRGQRRARSYSSQRIASLRGGASEQELTTWRETWPFRGEREFIDEELDRLTPAPQPASEQTDWVDQDIAALHESRRSVERLTEKALLGEALANADKHRHEYGSLWIVALADEVKRLSGLVRDFNTAAGTLAVERDDQTDRADRLDAVVSAVRVLREEYFDAEGGIEREDVWRFHRDLGNVLGEEEA